jgi:alpha-L-fucosidase
MRLTRFLIIAILVRLTFVSSTGQTVIRNELILTDPLFRQCHASTLAELGDEEILIAFFGGSFEGSPDVKIWGVFRTGGTWSSPMVLADGIINDSVTYPCWNPVLFRSGSGLVYLFYKVGKNPREWFGMMKGSSDKGRTWSQPIRLPDGILGPIKNKPVELPGNRLLCPSSIETATNWSVHLEIFDMNNGTWIKIPVGTGTSYDVIQPTLLKHSSTRYQILCRSKQNVVVSSFSDDTGQTWQPLTPLPLPNPNSGIDGVTLSDSTFLLVYNPLQMGQDWFNGRNKLSLASSRDGIQWTEIRVLEDRKKGEFSYPAIIQSGNGHIYITYTFDRKNIKFLELKL